MEGEDRLRERCYGVEPSAESFRHSRLLNSQGMAHLYIMAACLVLSSSGNADCITKDVFGTYNVPEKGNAKTSVYRYTLDNGKMSVQIMDYGATITSIKVPDSKGKLDDIVLGYDTLEGYFSSDNPYFGATVGRVANRIRGGQFTIDGVTYKVTQNEGDNTLHGGKRAFDKKLWSSKVDGEKVVMEYTSSDGEEGFPGEVTASVTYQLSSDNVLSIEYSATSTKRTPINLTNHAYFNLAGQGTGSEELYKHVINIKANRITETDQNNIPTGKFIEVRGTEFDLSESKCLGLAIKNTKANGFDNNYVMQEGDDEYITVAVAQHPDSGRWLEVQTTQPGLQFYTSNAISSIKGKSEYKKHAAFCMEAQNFPDAVNHKNFPNSVYGPGDTYHHLTQYKFGLSPSTN